MCRDPDKFAADDADWRRAVAHEAVIRPLASKDRLSPADIGLACRQLGVRRARLFELLGRYRVSPGTSSPLGHNPGDFLGWRCAGRRAASTGTSRIAGIMASVVLVSTRITPAAGIISFAARGLGLKQSSAPGI